MKGHGREVGEKEIQRQAICRRLRPGSHPIGCGDAGLGTDRTFPDRAGSHAVFAGPGGAGCPERNRRIINYGTKNSASQTPAEFLFFILFVVLVEHSRCFFVIDNIRNVVNFFTRIILSTVMDCNLFPRSFYCQFR